MFRYYAGIGSRQTPEEVLDYMYQTAERLAQRDWMLRSGGAIGADDAFEQGAGIYSEVYRARGCTPEAMVMAAEYHPNWRACTQYARQLHGRNCQIMLGSDVLRPVPVELVICWTEGGRVAGGTGQALRMAKALEIEVINLGVEDPFEIERNKSRINDLCAWDVS